MRHSLLVTLGVVAATSFGLARNESAPRPHPHRPVALALSSDGNWLYAANRDSASISIIDARKQTLAGEKSIGRRLVDLVVPDQGHLLAVDEAAGALLLFSCRDADIRILDALQVGQSPVSVRALADGKRCSVLLLWPRRVAIVEWQPALKLVKTIDLPFAPRLQLPIQDDSKLLVADAFGGQLAVVDLGRAVVEAVHSLPAHNIRGLALSADGKHVLLVHQHLSTLAHTTDDDIHWGNLLTNQLRALPLANLLAPKGDFLRGGRVEQLGDIDHGAGDPAGLAVGRDGTALVSIGGTKELLMRGKAETTWRRLASGKRPTTVAMSPDGRRAYVANTFGDSVSVVDLAKGSVLKEIPLGPKPELSPAQRGEELFHDARLSLEGWFSCHSCHTDGHTNGRLNDNLGDGSFGAPKRVLTLLGVKDTGPHAWNGGMRDLESQIRKSVATTMHGKALTDSQVQDLAAYLRTLEPPPGLDEARGIVKDAEFQRGQKVFSKLKCDTCHVPPTYTSNKSYTVGLADEMGNKLFNPPSLRGISQGGPYFHDGRAAKLEDVFTRHRHQLSGELNVQELTALLAYLRSL